jgi:uncharacterized membrane protein
MVTLTSIVSCITLVATQLAMGQFSPRIVRALLQDRKNQLAFELFAATFVHAILTVRESTIKLTGFRAWRSFWLTC